MRVSVPIQTGPGTHPSPIQREPFLIPWVKWQKYAVEHPHPSNAKVKERVELYIYSPSGLSWPVLNELYQFCVHIYVYIYARFNLCYLRIFRDKPWLAKISPRTTYGPYASWYSIISTSITNLPGTNLLLSGTCLHLPVDCSYFRNTNRYNTVIVLLSSALQDETEEHHFAYRQTDRQTTTCHRLTKMNEPQLMSCLSSTIGLSESYLLPSTSATKRQRTSKRSPFCSYNRENYKTHSCKRHLFHPCPFYSFL